MSTFLELRFIDLLGITRVVRFPAPKEDITAEQIKNLMDFIMEKRIFPISLEKIVDARIVTRGSNQLYVNRNR